MIARIWRGATLTEDAAAYTAYIQQTGISAYKSTPGNLGAWILQQDHGERTEFVTLSFWQSRQAIEAFAGKDIDKAVFYPDDDRYLVDRELTVEHYDMS